ncbi:unnamed protein product [Effrenium voratum]|nr:unnamed protein product [Effrenium voratum]
MSRLGDGALGAQVIKGLAAKKQNFQALVLMPKVMLEEAMARYRAVAGAGLYVLRLESGDEGTDIAAKVIGSFASFVMVGAYEDAIHFVRAHRRMKAERLSLLVCEMAHAALAGDKAAYKAVLAWHDVYRVSVLQSLFISSRSLEQDPVRGLEEATMEVPGMPTYQVVARPGGPTGPQVFDVPLEKAQKMGVTVPLKLVVWGPERLTEWEVVLLVGGMGILYMAQTEVIYRFMPQFLPWAWRWAGLFCGWLWHCDPLPLAVAMLQRGGNYFKDLEQATILYFARDQGVDPAAAGLLSIFRVCKVQGDNSAGSHVRVYCVTVLGNSRFLQLLSRRAGLGFAVIFITLGAPLVARPAPMQPWEVKRYERERRKTKSTYWITHELLWRDFVPELKPSQSPPEAARPRRTLGKVEFLNQQVQNLTAGQCEVSPRQMGVVPDALLIAGNEPDPLYLLQAVGRLSFRVRQKRAGYLLILGGSGPAPTAAWRALSEHDARLRAALRQAAVDRGRLGGPLDWKDLQPALQDILADATGQDGKASQWLQAVNEAVLTAAESWDLMYGHLLAYRETMEDPTRPVPVNAQIHGVDIGKWVARQFLEWRSGTLSAEKQELLEQRGLDVEEEGARSFAEGLVEFETYVKDSGSSYVPSGYFSSSGFPLYAWATKQWADWRRGKLTAEQQYMLDEVGFPPVRHPDDPKAQEYTKTVEAVLRNGAQFPYGRRKHIFAARALRRNL